MSQDGFILKRLRGVFYGWWLVAISGFVMVLATVPLFHAMSVWAVALEQHFGWNRTQLGFALTFTRIEGGLMGPVEGYLTDRFGTRRMVLVGLTILGTGFLVFGQVRTLWMFYLAYFVMALGQGLGSQLPLMTMLNHWFARRRATAIGWSAAGSRAGALLLVPAIAWTIDPDHDRLGWRVTASALGVFVLVVALPITRLIRNRPQDYNLRPDGDPPTLPPARARAGRSPAARRGEDSVESAGMTASQALRTRAFWLIAFGNGCTSMVLLAIMAHLGLLMGDMHFKLQTTAWIVTVYTSVSMVFQLIGGYVGDRISKRVALFIFASIQASAVVLLSFASTLTAFVLFAVLFGVGFGGGGPLRVAIRGDYFGRASFGKILGFSAVPSNLLLMAAAPFAGYMRDVRGSYDDGFRILAGMGFLGAFLFLMAKRPAPSPASRRAEAAQPGD